MSKQMKVTAVSGLVVVTDNVNIAQSFWMDGAIAEYLDGSPVFGALQKASFPSPAPLYPVWLRENEVNQLVAHWEKTGMFGTIIEKLRAAENIRNTK